MFGTPLGKTILASGIIDHLQREKEKTDLTSYFYCREDDLNESGRCMSLFKSLLRQLVVHNSELLLPIFFTVVPETPPKTLNCWDYKYSSWVFLPRRFA
jgi:hypothetical protein